MVNVLCGGTLYAYKNRSAVMTVCRAGGECTRSAPGAHPELSRSLIDWQYVIVYEFMK